MNNVLVYSIHKSGTMFLHRLLRQIAAAYGIRHFSSNYRLHRRKLQQTSWKELIERVNTPACFGPIRQGIFCPEFPARLEDDRVVLHLRDPRDVLTSEYFSHAYSHPKGRFGPTTESRKRTRRMEIDDYVGSRAQRFRRRYEELAHHLHGRDNVVVVKYEDMVTDFPQWLDRVLECFSHLAPRPRLRFRPVTHADIRDRLIRKYQHEFEFGSENVRRHKRQGQPGDHRRKLSPQTIDQLNGEFKTILDLFEFGDP